MYMNECCYKENVFMTCIIEDYVMIRAEWQHNNHHNYHHDLDT